jgi:hypothetical protein
MDKARVQLGTQLPVPHGQGCVGQPVKDGPHKSRMGPQRGIHRGSKHFPWRKENLEIAKRSVARKTVWTNAKKNFPFFLSFTFFLLDYGMSICS